MRSLFWGYRLRFCLPLFAVPDAVCIYRAPLKACRSFRFLHYYSILFLSSFFLSPAAVGFLFFSDTVLIMFAPFLLSLALASLAAAKVQFLVRAPASAVNRGPSFRWITDREQGMAISGGDFGCQIDVCCATREGLDHILTVAQREAVQSAPHSCRSLLSEEVTGRDK